jgi:amidase
MSERPANELSASAAAAQIRAGTLTSEALVRACLERIAAREPSVGAWEHLDADRAIAAAQAADRAPSPGALHGVPVGVKDIIDTVDMPTCLGSPIYAGRRPGWDAACVAAIRAAGGIVLGKTVTTEFAYFQPGKTRNPHGSRLHAGRLVERVGPRRSPMRWCRSRSARRPRGR